MIALLRHKNSIRSYLLFMLAITAASLSWSNYLISASTVMMSISLLFYTYEDKENWQILPSWQNLFFRLKKNKILLSCIALYFFTLLSGIWSDEIADWWRFGRLMLPLFMLSMVFLFHGHLFRSKDLYLILCLSVAAAFVSSLIVLFHYFENFDAYNQELLKGKAIKTPMSHVRFSLVMACSAVVSIAILLSDIFVRHLLIRICLVLLAIYFFAVVHILSVKTGLVGLYGGVLLALFFYAMRQKKYSYFLGGLLLLSCSILLAINFIPSVQKKYYYSVWQIGEWSRGKSFQYSDIERWVSMKMAWKLIQENPVLGTGIGDASLSTKKIYEQFEPGLKDHLPHNQYLFSWAFSGIASFLALCYMTWLCIFSRQLISHPVAQCLMAIIFSSLLFEATLTTNLGIGIFMFYLLVVSRLTELMISD